VDYCFQHIQEILILDRNKIINPSCRVWNWFKWQK